MGVARLILALRQEALLTAYRSAASHRLAVVSAGRDRRTGLRCDIDARELAGTAVQIVAAVALASIWLILQNDTVSKWPGCWLCRMQLAYRYSGAERRDGPASWRTKTRTWRVTFSMKKQAVDAGGIRVSPQADHRCGRRGRHRLERDRLADYGCRTGVPRNASHF